LTTDGAAWCWGANQYGQLGVDTVGDECEVDLMADGPCSLRPVRVSGGLTFRSIDAGSEHVCGITRDGVAYCWGKNIVGELGTTVAMATCKIPYYSKNLPDYEAEPCSHAPVRVATSLRFTSITAGNFFTCALTSGGRVFCWGGKKDGRVGAGGRFDRHPEVAAVGSNVRFSQVSIDGSLACGLSTDGDAYCWGGELSVNPTRAKTSAKFVSVSRGWGHTCALTRDGAAYCWGKNDAGQLGVGKVTRGLGEPDPQPVGGELRFRSLEAGFTSTCGITSGGELYCWGDGETLGAVAPDKCFHVDAFSPCSTRPVRISLKNVTVVSGGFMHRCALAAEDALYCWGSNDAGAFGNGTRRGSELPTRIRFSKER
jgi:alpha-tubulin suppressor-like RCC1 family protein